MSMWIAGTLAVTGIGTTIYGADKQRKATNQANDANKAAVDENNRLQWAQYLMSRGINPGTNVQPGVIPTNAAPMNTKLPLWASVSRSAPDANGARRFVRVMPNGGGNPFVSNETTMTPGARSWGGLAIR